MTLLEINLTDVLSETDPDDRVIVWAPVMREGPAGQLVGPRRKSIPLTDGVGSDEVVPGPLMVQVQCKAMSDTRPREVVVPEEGPVTLTDLLHETFTYTPAVVNASLTQITTARDAALADVDGAVDQALAGSQRYSGTGFPNGVVAAPVGSIYTDTAATNGAIRWIKTSGTGNTGWQVEYGDTGWRDVSSSIEDRMSPLEFTDGAKLLVRRIGGLTYLKISGRVYVRKQFGKLCDNFTGFRPEGYSQFNLSKSADINAGVWQIRVESGTVDGEVTSGADRSIMGYWDVAQSWPSTLPGIPA